jgi:uncharacterized membrane protein YphA (DoxX/SURF4 family)
MNKSKLVGWILSGLLFAMLVLASATSKFVDWPNKQEQFDKLGWTIENMYIVGVIEVAAALLFMIPRTGMVGAILLTGYLGGAIATHLRVGDSVLMPVILAVVAWIALGLRDGRIFNTAFRPQSASGQSN